MVNKKPWLLHLISYIKFIASKPAATTNVPITHIVVNTEFIIVLTRLVNLFNSFIVTSFFIFRFKKTSNNISEIKIRAVETIPLSFGVYGLYFFIIILKIYMIIFKKAKVYVLRKGLLN